MPPWPYRDGDGAVQKAQACIGSRDHRSQWLSDLVSDRRRDRISRHQPRLTLAALGKNRAEQPRIKRLYLVQQDNEDENAGQEIEDPDGIPADAEARRIRVVAERLVHEEQEQDDHQPKIEHRASPDPESDDGGNAEQRYGGPDVRPQRTKARGIDSHAWQQRFARYAEKCHDRHEGRRQGDALDDCRARGALPDLLVGSRVL